ncbi:MAG: biopolymer transporter TonB [Lysobacteraceae bacterium]|nr:MAG: biopolymer transporter TonB [Xanthomonadaceae bacterium]
MSARLALLLALFLARLPMPLAAETGAADEDAGAGAPRVRVEDAFRREFALLETQKRELTQQIEQTRAAMAAERRRLEAEIGRLEAGLLAAQSEAASAQEALTRAEQQAVAGADAGDLIGATLEQAASTLRGLGLALPSVEAIDEEAVPARLQAILVRAGDLLAALATVQQEPGRYYLADGTEVEGTLIRYGDVARFAVGQAGSGALAPAGGGRFRLLAEPDAAASAQALAGGTVPPVLKAFLFDNPNVAVEEPAARSLLDELRKGGLIGYVILLLGAVAAVLVVLRAVFLHSAGSSVAAILEAITPAIRQRRTDEAIAQAKRFKGSAARVVTAALRNADRDREHLEDIVAESILHESGRLNRFGSLITVIAAVAPLLGLLGTVTGMIQTFEVITEFGTSDPKLLSGGIATALVTTELGLIVAIPCLLLGSLLAGWAERIKDDMEKAALRAINLHMASRTQGA